MMAVFLQAAVLAGCVATLSGQADSGEYVLQEGQSTALPGFEAALTFVEKMEDSRCPTGVTCVWEGRVRVLLEFVRSGQAASPFEMVGFVGPNGKGESEPTQITHEAFGLRFTLVRLDPYPAYGVKKSDPVTATIRVEALENTARMSATSRSVHGPQHDAGNDSCLAGKHCRTESTVLTGTLR